jgi:hypothetical protein
MSCAALPITPQQMCIFYLRTLRGIPLRPSLMLTNMRAIGE